MGEDDVIALCSVLLPGVGLLPEGLAFGGELFDLKLVFPVFNDWDQQNRCSIFTHLVSRSWPLGAVYAVQTDRTI